MARMASAGVRWPSLSAAAWPCSSLVERPPEDPAAEAGEEAVDAAAVSGAAGAQAPATARQAGGDALRRRRRRATPTLK